MYKTYSLLKRDQIVARAIGIGLLTDDEVPEEIRQMLAGPIAHFREDYEIDEDDPLFEVRKRAISRHRPPYGQT